MYGKVTEWCMTKYRVNHVDRWHNANHCSKWPCCLRRLLKDDRVITSEFQCLRSWTRSS